MAGMAVDVEKGPLVSLDATGADPPGLVAALITFGGRIGATKAGVTSGLAVEGTTAARTAGTEGVSDWKVRASTWD